MTRRLIIMSCIALSLVLVTISVLAATWFCPECGKSNEGNFCYNCGEKRPPVEEADGAGISDIQCKVQDNGDVLVTWNDSSGLTPYTVTYQGEHSSGESNPVDIKRDTLVFLIPGCPYTITVSNANSHATTKFTIPIKVFTEFSATSRKITLTESTFSISEAQQDKTKDYRIQFHYPLLRKDRSYKGKLVTKTPLGYGGYVWVWDTFDLESRYDYIYTDFSMYEFFSGLEIDFGEPPTGQYTFEMFFDGRLYASSTFTVIK